MKSLLYILALYVGVAGGLPAQSIWTGATGAQWGNASNWSPTGIPNGVNGVVNWTNNVQPYLTVGGPFTNGTVNFLSGSGSVAFGDDTVNDLLTAQTSTGVPTFYVTNGGNVYCYVQLSGTQGFAKTGPGTLTFRYNSMTQPYMGSVQILGGSLGIQADYSLGNPTNNVIITNGASMIEASSANGGVFWLSPARTITLAGGQAQIAVNNSAYTLVIPGVINENYSDSGFLWNSAGELILSNANAFTGSLTMTAGTLDLANSNALKSGTLTANGGTLLFDKAVTGNAFTLGGLAGTAGILLQNNATTPAPITLTVGSNNASTAYFGNLTGTGALLKTGSGTLTLGGTNNYTGATTIAAGRLVTTTASQGGGQVLVADGATNQVALTIPGRTLSASSVTLGISSGAALEFNNQVLANPAVPALWATNLTLKGKVTVNIYGPAFAYYPGTIPLLAYTFKSGGGSWSLGLLPAGMVASLNDTGSELQLVITSVNNPVIAETVSFSPGNPGMAINPAFCGLSYEKAALTGSLFTSNNLSLLAMFGQIAPAVLRLGGNSVDTTCWGGVSNLPAITPAQVDAFAGFVKALPPTWHVIYGINMVVNSPTNCAAEAAYAARVLGSRLLGFEIGNEPDLYHDWVSPTYTYSQFLPQWQALAAGITNNVPGWAVANGGSGWVLTGPASSYNTKGYTMPFATNSAAEISLVTQHYYRGSGTNVNSTMALLLTPDASLPGTVTNIVGAAMANHLSLGFRMDESGSFSGGGNTNSSQYGTALWTLDVMFTEAAYGCQGVNFHGGGNGTSSYTPIADNGTAVVQARPEFYGLKLFSLASQGSALPVSLSPNPSISFTAYGVRQTNGAYSAVLLDKETNTGVQATINLGTNVAAAQVLTLTGPALNSMSGYTLGGAPINADGSWAGGFQSTIPATNGVATFTVLPMTAVWLKPLLPPLLAAIPNHTLVAGATLSVTNAASDPNAPDLALGFTLPVAPAGASINPANGLIHWRPLMAQGGTTNLFNIVVVNTAGLASTQSFAVTVLAPQKPLLTGAAVTAGDFQLTINGSYGPDYSVQGATNAAAATWQTLFTTNAPAVPFAWADTNVTRPQYYYRLLLGP